MLIVLTPATTYDLTTLETVKTELEITGSTQDSFIGELIRQASGDVARYCNRVLALESVREVIRIPWRSTAGEESSRLWLRRVPVVSITLVTENATTLVEGTDFECDQETGRLTRLAGGDALWWNSGGGTWGWSGVVVVEYSGGYELLPDLPYDIERSTIDLIKRRYYSRSRDPALRSQQVLDIITKSYTAESSEPTVRGLPRSIAERLDDYVRAQV
jgi:hypothetical protein